MGMDAAARLAKTVIALCSGIAIEPLTHKPGCVSRFRDVADKKLLHFYLCSATCSSLGLVKGLEIASRGLVDGDVGEIVDALAARMSAVGSNVCLGSSILLAPLIAAEALNAVEGIEIDARRLCSRASLVVRERCGPRDTLSILRAIARVMPSYVHREPPCRAPSVLELDRLREVPRLWSVIEACRGVDTVFDTIFRGYRPCLEALSFLRSRLETHREWDRAVLDTFLFICAKVLDQTLVRRVGREFAERVSEMCREALEASERGSMDRVERLLEALDLDLLQRRVSPGSLADLCAVTISLYLYETCSELSPSR